DGFEELMKMEAEEEKKYPSINRGHNQVYLEYWIDGDYIGSNVISYQKFPRPPPHGPFGSRRSLPPQFESTRHFSQKPQEFRRPPPRPSDSVRSIHSQPTPKSVESTFNGLSHVIHCIPEL